VAHSFPWIYVANSVVLTTAADGGRALPPREGGLQPGSPLVPSFPDIGPPFRTLCVTTPGTTLTSATPKALSPVDCLTSEPHEDSDHLLPGVPQTSPVAPPPGPWVAPAGLGTDPVFRLPPLECSEPCAVPTGPGTDPVALSLPVDCSDVVQPLPGIYLTKNVTPVMAVEGGRALPPCEGGVQPGSPQVPSSPDLDPPSQTLCVTPPGTTLTSAIHVAPSPNCCWVSELNEDSDPSLPGVPRTSPVAPPPPCAGPAGLGADPVVQSSPLESSDPCAVPAGPVTDPGAKSPPLDCPVASTAAAEVGRALPSLVGWVQPGLPPVPSPPDVDPPSHAVCVTTPGTTFASSTPVALPPDYGLVSELHEYLDPSLSEVPLTSPAALHQTPVWVLLAQEQTLSLNRHLLHAQLWTVPCLGSIWGTPWY